MASVVKSFCAIGPECSGKTSLCVELVAKSESTFVHEYAREFLDQIKRPYEEADLVSIARTHFSRTQRLINESPFDTVVHLGVFPWVFIDTDLTVIKIWSLEKYGRVDPKILELLEEERYDLYFLCRPDLPWVQDGMRENPNDRDRLFTLYEKELVDAGKRYVIIEGEGEERMSKARKAMNIVT